MLLLSRNADATEERPALECAAAQEAGAGQADWTHRRGDLGGRRGAGALGDPGLHRKVRHPQPFPSLPKMSTDSSFFFNQSTDLILSPSLLKQQAGEREVTGYRFLQDHQQSEDVRGREGAPGESAEAGQDGCPAGGSSGLGTNLGLALHAQPRKHIAAILKKRKEKKMSKCLVSRNYMKVSHFYMKQ